MPLVMHQVQSSLLKSVGYDDVNKELYVVFKKPRSRYVYFDVSPELFNEFLEADSVDRFFLANIKGHFTRYQTELYE